MRLLGFDIGTKNIGWASMVNDNIISGTFHVDNGKLYERLDVLVLHVDALIDEINPNFVGIEDVWIGPNKAVGIKLAKAWGAVAAIAWKYGSGVFAFNPRAAKKVLVGTSKVSKEDIFVAANKITPCDTQDAADAVAVLVALDDFIKRS